METICSNLSGLHWMYIVQTHTHKNAAVSVKCAWWNLNKRWKAASEWRNWKIYFDLALFEPFYKRRFFSFISQCSKSINLDPPHDRTGWLQFNSVRHCLTLSMLENLTRRRLSPFSFISSKIFDEILFTFISSVSMAFSSIRNEKQWQVKAWFKRYKHMFSSNGFRILKDSEKIKFIHTPVRLYFSFRIPFTFGWLHRHSSLH